MISIADVIGWKFDNQPGMRCQEDKSGNLVIVEFPGGIPSQADQDTWTAEYESYIAGPRHHPLNQAQFLTVLDELLSQHSLSRQDVFTAIDSLPVSLRERVFFKNKVLLSESYHFDNPLISTVAASLNISMDDISTLWMQAVTLK